MSRGTLEAGRVEFGDGTSTLNFNHTGATTFTAALTSSGTGTHTVNHLAGITTLIGDSSGFTGTTTVSAGTLLVGTSTGDGLGGSIIIGSGGLFGGAFSDQSFKANGNVKF